MLNNPKAQKLIKKILADLDHAGIITNTLVNDLKELRPYVVEENQPVLAKAIRLSYEHVETYATFAIPIPEDEPIEGEETTTEPAKPEESLAYLVELIRDADNKLNMQEIREYNNAFLAYETD